MDRKSVAVIAVASGGLGAAITWMLMKGRDASSSEVLEAPAVTAEAEVLVPANYDKENVFAKILRGEIPSNKIFETDYSYAMLDAFPSRPFHSLLIPKTPSVDLGDLSSQAAAAFLADLPKLVKAVKLASGAPAVKIFSNAGKEAGQIVFHTHIHVIPMFPNSKKCDAFPGSAQMILPDEATKVLQSLHAHLDL